MSKNTGKRVGIIAGCFHFAGFLATAIYVISFHNPQAGVAWIYWYYIDFPISLVYAIPNTYYYKLIEMLGDSFLAQLVYLPHFTHGLLGTIWWYFLPRLFLPKRFGGIWGAVVNPIGFSSRNDS